MFKHRETIGKIKTCIIKRDNVGDWYAIFTTELPNVPKVQPKTEIGVDVGLPQLIRTTDGEKVESLRFLKKGEERIKHWQREVSRKVKGSGKRKKCVKILAKAHRRVERQRDDFLQKESRRLVGKADTIVFEDLQIQNMLKNHHLAKSINDASWGKLMQYTAYKAEEAGKSVYFVNPYNTSQICSECGTMVRKSLSERVHRCSTCGFSVDRDLNASLNILNRYLQKRVGWDTAELYKRTPVEMLSLPLPEGCGK
jgi:putative transposase